MVVCSASARDVPLLVQFASFVVTSCVQFASFVVVTLFVNLEMAWCPKAFPAGCAFVFLTRFRVHVSVVSVCRLLALVFLSAARVLAGNEDSFVVLSRFVSLCRLFGYKEFATGGIVWAWEPVRLMHF